MSNIKKSFLKVMLLLGMSVCCFGLITAPAGAYHSADNNPADYEIGLSELLRAVQIYNIGAYHCAPGFGDGYAPADGDMSCEPHDSDYNPQDWSINLSELLRLIQFYTSSGYEEYQYGEDGFSPEGGETEFDGTTSVVERGGVRIHTYLSDALQATHIIESANSLVLVDAQFMAPFAKEFRSYADSLGKPVERVIISHGHPDHFFGLGAAFDDMSDRIYALEGVRQFIETVGPGMLENMRPRLGDAAPDKIVVPTQVIEPGAETIDGVRYEFERYEDGEAAEQLVIRLPDLNILILQDLTFNGLHLYMGNNTLDGWITILESLQGLGGYDTVLCGHGEPGGMSVIAANIAYLENVNEILASVDNAEDFKAQLLAEYPDLGSEGYIDMSAPALIPEPEFEGTTSVVERGGVRIHTYLSDALQATHIIESENSLVLVDAQFMAPFAKEFRSYADSLDKPVERVIISHGHPDHFFGLGAAFDDMSDRIYALEGVRQFIETVGPGMLENMRPRLGDAAPDKIVVPTQVIEPGAETIDGVRYEFVRYEDGEASEQLVIRLPDLNILILQDLAFNGLHLYMGNNTLDGWITILESLQGLGGYDTVLCGHGEPGGMSVIAANIAYLEDVNEILASVDNAEDFKAQLLAEYPDLGAANFIDISTPALFPEPEFEGTTSVTERGGVRIHTYLSPVDNDLNGTHVIESENSLVVVDAQLLVPYAQEFRAYIDSLGKPVERVIISHNHVDRFFGLEAAFDDMSDRIYALEGVREFIGTAGPGLLEQIGPMLGDAAPDKIVVPTRTLEPGTEIIDGVTYEFERYTDGESPEQVVIRLPALNTLILQGLTFNDCHLYMGNNTLDGWITILESLQGSSEGYDTVLSAHGEPGDMSVIAANIAYLEDANEILADVDNAGDFKTQLLAKYPGLGSEGYIDMSTPGLFPEPDAVAFDSDRWEFTGESTVEDYLGRKSLSLGGGGSYAVVKDSEFTDGIIEYDVAFSQERAFMGAIWRQQDSGNYEEFYMRAHQSGNPDANQYTPVYNALPAWQLYYGERFSTPTLYDFDEWTHVKIVVSGKYADIYVRDMDNPALTVELLREVRAGRVGLWAMRGPAHFADFSFTPINNPTIKGTPAETEDAPAETVMSWSVSDAFDGTSLDGKFTLAEDDKQYLTWTTLACERTGLANLARVQGLGEGKNTVYARIIVTSDREQMKMLRFGFSDRVKVYFNDQLIFGGSDVFNSRDYRFLGTIGFHDGLCLPLKQGENEIWMAVSEAFGGWGVQARFDDMEGISVQK